MKNLSAACLLFAFLACLSWGRFIQAQSDDDYEAEIMQHIVDPCFKYSAERSDNLDMWTVEEAIEMMKLLSPEAVQDTLDITMPVVKGKPPEDRMKIYKLSLDLCIKGTGK